MKRGTLAVAALLVAACLLILGLALLAAGVIGGKSYTRNAPRVRTS